MKTYIVKASLDYNIDKSQIFKGESIEDPKMLENICEWLSHFDDQYNYDIFDFEKLVKSFKNTPEDVSTYGIRIYEIANGPMLIPGIWKTLEKYLEEKSKSDRIFMEAKLKEDRRLEYERLKKEFDIILRANSI